MAVAVAAMGVNQWLVSVAVSHAEVLIFVVLALATVGMTLVLLGHVLPEPAA